MKGEIVQLLNKQWVRLAEDVANKNAVKVRPYSMTRNFRRMRKLVVIPTNYIKFVEMPHDPEHPIEVIK